jgi:hypothetical protein
MSRKGRAMAIRPIELENPERDLELTTRRAGLAPGARLAAARALTPPLTIGCGTCWEYGRDAAIEAVGASGVGAARGIEPSDAELHWRDCWTKGRDAALAVIEGR